MKFHYDIFHIFPLWNQHVADHIVEIILRNTGNTKLQHGFIDLLLSVGTVGLELMAFHQRVNVSLVLVDLRTGCSEVEVAVVYYGSMSLMGLGCTRDVILDEGVKRF